MQVTSESKRVSFTTLIICADANIQVTESELKKLGRTSIPLADGSGNYLGALGSFVSNIGKVLH